DYMLAEVNAFLRRPVTRADIVWSYSGVRPLFEVGGGRDNDLSTLTRDYSFEIDAPEGAPPVLTVFGGKLTTHRKLAEHAMKELHGLRGWSDVCRTRTEVLPGGDFGAAGKASYEATVRKRFPWLPEAQVARYVQQYGTRVENLLSGVNIASDLGECFGADLYQREVDFLVSTEWAEAPDDVIWRRTKVGLRLSQGEIGRLRGYLAALNEGAV
ncbi:MAG: glycerol-3-phosphate dehydrogenase, partial [Mesorhizobium sp.]|uniref:glycerol-3-phosphate dehydrogenase C-terminal domain-containing protein n=1 Tax=Mesorhizobium sp. TaxID=1871066 RepID=UPI001AC1D5D3